VRVGGSVVHSFRGEDEVSCYVRLLPAFLSAGLPIGLTCRYHLHFLALRLLEEGVSDNDREAVALKDRYILVRTRIILSLGSFHLPSTVLVYTYLLIDAPLQCRLVDQSKLSNSPSTIETSEPSSSSATTRPSAITLVSSTTSSGSKRTLRSSSTGGTSKRVRSSPFLFIDILPDSSES
jgi:hypothetical protein